MVIKTPSENFNNKPTDRSAKSKEIQHLQIVQQLKEEQKMNITYHKQIGSTCYKICCTIPIYRYRFIVTFKFWDNVTFCIHSA